MKAIESLLAKKNYDTSNWQPQITEPSSFVIDVKGRWVFDGGVINRAALIELLFQLLRVEFINEQRHYFIITPHAKISVLVEQYPLFAIDFNIENQRLLIKCQNERWYHVDRNWNYQHGMLLSVPSGFNDVSNLNVDSDNGLEVAWRGNSFYHFVEYALEHGEQKKDQLFLTVGPSVFNLGCVTY